MHALIVLLAVLGAQGETSVEVEIDFSAARTILTLPGSQPSDEELERVAGLPGVVALISQSARFNPEANRENFIAGLGAFASGRDPQPDPFNFARLRSRQAETTALLRRIEADPEKLERDVIARMLPYTPPGVYETQLILVVAGTSDGFAPGRGQLYVAIDYVRDDWDGLVVITAHELYHAIQAFALDRSGIQKRINDLTGHAKEATALLVTTLKEGTGSLVGDPLTVKKPGSYTSWFSEKYNRNLNRLPQNFALFETLLFRLANDDVAFNKLYPLAFGGNWDSPLYFVGYRIAKVIEKYDGATAVQNMWSEPPAAVLQRYIELAAKHPGDRDIVPLSDTAIAIVHELAGAWKPAAARGITPDRDRARPATAGNALP